MFVYISAAHSNLLLVDLSWIGIKTPLDLVDSLISNYFSVELAVRWIDHFMLQSGNALEGWVARFPTVTCPRIRWRPPFTCTWKILVVYSLRDNANLCVLSRLYFFIELPEPRSGTS